ncbi:MAG TPA: patatin-like phospholipase family protein [Candidatus Ornithomonoglobus merdipullorum]|uniref:Patatin-like phospholipase family protein n=1 Tax=Candidatus Ornithomonoglobus merdipullorum TaxID=2840895 RepID=A0A9D1M9U7_9FIRM|nr:patatin-like phospholipase family protein [Candidatus Ornithomonoglobus merdipullorum]
MKYALSLAGGGTRGAFQAGVWRALCEMGLEITAITGTSIGAVNGAMFAMGEDTAEMWSNISVDDIVDVPKKHSNLLSPDSLLTLAKNGTNGGLDTTPFRRLLTSLISEDRIRSSGVEFGLCTFCVTDKKSVELFLEDIPEGKVVDYILASACFPVFKPVMIDGKEYSDGSARNNLPINMLTDRDYDTIISVSVRGVGVIRDFDGCGANIIKIKSPTPEVGLMDFDRDAIKRSIKSGYFECMKAFGKFSGDSYSFYNDSYNDAVSVYGKELIRGMEAAAAILDIDRYTPYKFEQLARMILAGYKKSPRLRHLSSYIGNGKSGFIHEKLDLLGDLYSAANSIVYLSKYLQ